MKKPDHQKEVWKSLSEFYLDTELQDSDYLRIFKSLRKSNLSTEELKEIDLYEVFPSLQANLNSVAGEWAGFNEEWLIQECTKNAKRRGSVFFRLLTRMRNRWSYWMRKGHWARIEELARIKAQKSL